MEQIFKCLICGFFGFLTYLLGDSLHGCPLLSAFLMIVGLFFTVYPLLTVLKLVIIIGFMASTCVLFYPQETARQKAVKIGCYLGDISAVIFVVEIIQKYFS